MKWRDVIIKEGITNEWLFFSGPKDAAHHWPITDGHDYMARDRVQLIFVHETILSMVPASLTPQWYVDGKDVCGILQTHAIRH